MSKTKKPRSGPPPHPVLESIEQARRDVAESIAKRMRDQADAAYRTLGTIAENGVNESARVSAAKAILEIAGVTGVKANAQVKATMEDADGRKIVVEVVHIDKPPATDDE